jgi:Domain of unknown function (DUF4160)
VPTVLRKGPYRFFFYSADRAEPPHVHIQREQAKAKFWLEPVAFERANGFSGRELLELRRLIEKHRTVLLDSFYEYFGH